MYSVVLGQHTASQLGWECELRMEGAKGSLIKIPGYIHILTRSKYRSTRKQRIRGDGGIEWGGQRVVDRSASLGRLGVLALSPLGNDQNDQGLT